MRLVVSAPGFATRSPRRRDGWSAQTVLVALEDGRERGWIAATLRHHGFNVLTARHAGHALLVMFRHVQGIDVLVADTQLSDMTGEELSERIRSYCPDLDAIVVSRPLRPGAILSRLHARR